MSSVLSSWNIQNKHGIKLASESGKKYQGQELNNSIAKMSAFPKLIYSLHAMVIKMNIYTQILKFIRKCKQPRKVQIFLKKNKPGKFIVQEMDLL